MTTRSAPLVLALLALLGGPGLASGAATRAFVLTTDFSSGSLSTVNLDTRAVSPDVEPAGSDATFRWYGGNLYVVNRFGGDNVQVIDGATLNTVRQISTGNGSNPQDICFVSPGKAYVTRYELRDVLIVNPATGGTLGIVPLGAFADADGIPEMTRMVRVDRYVFVALQRLNRSAGFAPTDSSLVAVIDTWTDTVVDADPAHAGVQAIKLFAKNPITAFEFDPAGKKLLIGCVGAFGQLDGGIERVDPITMTSAGLAISEAFLGGDLADIVWYTGTRSFAIVSDASFNTLLKSWNPSIGEVIGTVYAPGGYSLTDAAVNDRGELYVCNNNLFDPGLHVFAAGTGTHLAGPLDCGLPPHDVTFDAPSEQVLAVPEPVAALALGFPAPNPARSGCRISLASPRGEFARVEMFDLSGRRIKTLLDGPIEPGVRMVEWDLCGDDGLRVPPGVYVMRARVGEETVGRRVVVQR